MAGMTEDQLASRIDNARMLGTDGKARPGGSAQARQETVRDLGRSRTPAARQQPAQTVENADTEEDLVDETSEELEYADDADPGDETPEEQEEAPEDEDGAEDGIDDPKLGRGFSPQAMQTISQLREELAELRGMLKGRDTTQAASTDGEEGAAAPDSPAGQKAAKAAGIKAVKETLAKNMDKWGELANDIGLPALLDNLEAMEARMTARDKAEEQAKQQQAQQQQQQQIAAANNIHKALNRMSKSDPALMQAIGFGQHETLRGKAAETRARIIRAAYRAAEDSQDEVQAGIRREPITFEQAIAIGVHRVTGRDHRVKSPQAQAQQRGRMVRPYGSADTAAPGRKESSEQIEGRLAKSVDEAMKFLQR